MTNNYLRTKKITIGDKELTVKEISIAGQLRLQAIDNQLFDPDHIRECLGPEQYSWFDSNRENIPRSFVNTLRDAVLEVNLPAEAFSELRQAQNKIREGRSVTSDSTSETSETNSAVVSP